MKNSALSWSSLRLRRVSLLAVACLLPVVACSGAVTGVAEEAPSPELPDAAPMRDGAPMRDAADPSELEVSAPELAEDASTPVVDATTDALSDASANTDSGDAAAGVVILASGDVPVPVAIQRIVYSGPASGTGPNPSCPSGQTRFSPLLYTTSMSCCFKSQVESLVRPLRVIDRTVGGVEQVCLEGGGYSVCAPVDAQGLATFVESIALGQLYTYWGLMYLTLYSDTSLSVRLSSARDLATMKISVAGRIFGSGCGFGQGTYLPNTTLDISMR